MRAVQDNGPPAPFVQFVRAARLVIDKAGPAAGLIILYVYFGATTKGFLSAGNHVNMGLQIAVVALLAIGETFVIVAGGIDLSVGSVLALSGVTTALLLASPHPMRPAIVVVGGIGVGALCGLTTALLPRRTHPVPVVVAIVGSSVGALLGLATAWLLTRRDPVPVPVAIGAGIGVGTLCGLVNGLLVTQADLPPFIATLGMMGICRGLAKIQTQAQNIDLSGATSFMRLGSGRIPHGWGVPIPVAVLLAVALIAFLVLRFTSFGRYCYAMGSNKEAARLSGVNVKLHTTAVYAVCGLLAGLAGVVQTTRISVGQPTGGAGYELDGIAAAVIGGASLMGGIGTIAGTMLGALIMAVLRSGCDLKGLSLEWQEVVIGAAIILAVLADRIRQR